MSKLFKKRLTASGARPGTLVFPQDAVPPRMRTMRYTREELTERDISTLDELREELSRPGIVWIDVQGIGDEDLIRGIADLFSIHLLTLENVVNAPQRPKTECFENHQFFLSRMVRLDSDGELEVEQVSIFFGDDFVLTFQEIYGDVFDSVRVRVRNELSRIRAGGPDYLSYAIIDAIVDGYFPVLEQVGEELEDLEAELIHNATPSMLEEINGIKRNLLLMRRGIWPQRDAVNMMIRDDSRFIRQETTIFLRDCYDHCVQVADVLDTFRETAGALLSTYLSAIGNKTNEVMKVLTIMASIFIPLTFMAGIYGMNFENMPELHYRHGYPLLITAMIVTAIGMLAFFQRLGWLWNPGGSKAARRRKARRR